jgi:hypothetical protein
MSERVAGQRRTGPFWDRRWLAVAAVTAGVSVAAVAVYLFAYPFHDIHPVGFDIQAYVWQTKAVGHGPLAAVGARPGLPAMAALLGSVIRAEPPREVVVLMPVLALVLALAVAGSVRLAFGLSMWSVPVVAAVVVLFPGTARVVHGYQASLLVMILAVAGGSILVHADGRRRALVTAGTVFLAACLSHVVLFALFGAIVGLYVLLSIPGFLRDREAGVPLARTDAGAATITFLPAAVLGAGAVYGWLGSRPGSTINTTNVASSLHQRTLSEVRRIRPFVIGPMAAVGGVFGWANRASRVARATARLGLAWLAVTLAGTLAGLIGHNVAGHRFLLFAEPIPALAGLGVVAAGRLLMRRPGLGWKVVGVAAVALQLVVVSASGVSYFYSQTNPRRGAIYPQLRAASIYLERYGGDRPLVFIVDDRRGALAAYSPKYRSYVIKAGVPDASVGRTFVYPGTLENLQAGRPTILAEAEPWQRTFNQVSRDAWRHVEPALRQGAVVLIAQAFASRPYEAAMAQDPGRRVARGLYVVRGQARALATVPAEPASGLVPGALTAAGLFLLMGLLGWGPVSTALGPAGATALDQALIAPAVGAAVAVIAGFLVAALGGNPWGPVGLVVVALLAVASVALGRVARVGQGKREPSSPEPA